MALFVWTIDDAIKLTLVALVLVSLAVVLAAGKLEEWMDRFRRDD